MQSPSNKRHTSSNRSRAERLLDPGKPSLFRTLGWVLPVSLGLLVCGYWLATRGNATRQHDERQAELWMSDAPSGGSDGISSRAVDGILREMLAAYRNVNSYSDMTRMHLRAAVAGNWRDEFTELHLIYQRPNRIRLEMQRPGEGLTVTMVSDGHEMMASVTDPATGDFDGQFAMRLAPRRLTVPDLYAITEYADITRPNELFSMLMTVPAQLQFSQLSPLLDDSPFGPLITQASGKTRLPDDLMDGHRCVLIQLDGQVGKFVFWIDAATKLLRRIEFPSAGPADNPTATLVSTFQNIRTSLDVPETTFKWKPTAGARLVRNFVLPPDTVASLALNQSVENLQLVDLAGVETSTGEWRDAISIVGWFQCRLPHRAMLVELQNVCEKLGKQGGVRVIAVCTDAANVSDAEVRDQLAEWQVALPVWRDLDGVAQRQLRLTDAPSLIVVDADGIIQVEEAGVTPGLDEQLPLVVDKLLAKAPLAKNYIEFLQTQRQEYNRALAAAGIEAPAESPDFAATKMAPAQLPEHLSLSELWSNEEIPQPGNLFAYVTPTDQLRMFVLSRFEVWELTTDGTVKEPYRVARGEFPCTKLDAAMGRSGMRYLLWSNLGRQVALFDKDWRPLMVYPPVEQSHAGIIDACLADLSGDGELACYVGFADSLGVHCVDGNGTLVWDNRQVAPLLSVTSSPDRTGQSYLLVTGQSGEITPISAAGVSQQAMRVGNHALHELRVADRTGTTSPFCGVTFLPDGSQLAIGVDGKLSETFREPLPAGIFATPVQYVQSCELGGQRLWLLGGADGSIHFVSEDGKFRDRWLLGEPLTGLAAVQTGTDTIVYVATPSAVQAYSLSWDLGRDTP